MVSEIRIYVEGGGDGSDTKALVRAGFGVFLRELRDMARQRRIRWTIVACGPRNSAFDDYRTACRTYPHGFNVLLVDSEGPVSATPWQHLSTRDGWTASTRDEQCHLMVQMMEAWLIADMSALQRYYGQDFREGRIPNTSDVESVSKSQLESALEHATRDTQKGPYHKIRHGAELLKLIDPKSVRSRARHCERLFSTLTKQMT